MVFLRKEVYQMIGTPLLSIISFISLMFSKRREDNPSSSHSLSHVNASYGTLFLLAVMSAATSAFSATLPVRSGYF